MWTSKETAVCNRSYRLISVSNSNWKKLPFWRWLYRDFHNELLLNKCPQNPSAVLLTLLIAKFICLFFSNSCLFATPLYKILISFQFRKCLFYVYVHQDLIRLNHLQNLALKVEKRLRTRIENKKCWKPKTLRPYKKLANRLQKQLYLQCNSSCCHLMFYINMDWGRIFVSVGIVQMFLNMKSLVTLGYYYHYLN